MINSTFYFLFFAMIAVYVPYFPLFLNDLGLTPVQIGTIYSLRSVAFMFFPIFFGYLADRWRARKPLLLLASAGQIVPLLLMVRLHTYGWLLILSGCFALFNTIVLPFVETATQEEHEKGKLDYGRTRLWGTLGFVLFSIGFGKFLDHVEEVWILYGCALLLLPLFFLSHFISRGKSGGEFRHEALHKIVSTRAAWLFFLCVLLMQASHGTFYGFYSIHLHELGYKDSSIGLQWATTASSEFLIFFFSLRILNLFSYGFLFSLALLVAVLRWLLTWSTTSYWWLLVIQCLHAFTFGLFHVTSLRLVQKYFPEGYRSLGQAVYTSAAAGVGGWIGLFLSGYLWEMYGSNTFLVSAGIAAFALGISVLMKKEPGVLQVNTDRLRGWEP